MQRRILITGPTSGAGRYLSETLGKRGDQLILVGRNREAMERVSSDFEPGQIRIVEADFSSIRQTVEAARQIQQLPVPLDGFIANAGMLGRDSRKITDEGFEETFVVNYLSHYTLLCHLLPKMASRSSLLFISSMAASWFSIPFDDVQSARDYSPMKAYGRSKAMLKVMGSWLAEQIPVERIRIHHIDPGTFRSGIARSRGPWFRNIYRLAAWAMRSPEKAMTDVLRILQGELHDYPSGTMFRKGKAHQPSFSSEEFGKLLEISAALSGYDIRKSLPATK